MTVDPIAPAHTWPDAAGSKGNIGPSAGAVEAVQIHPPNTPRARATQSSTV